MPRVYESGIIPATPAEVWQRIRDFNALPDWHPAIARSELEGERDIGVVRHFFLNDGGELREQLLALSDRDRSCRYTIVESPMALTNYDATLRLYPVTATGETFVEWYAFFDVTEPGAEEETTQAVSGVFSSGIESLRAHFAG
ncbi:MAG: SRPBCC family protein [Synergistales bacterium]|nr:SRPBCC family protein [Synergistales bacterium]